MSEFKVEVKRVEIEEHPNADRLEVARIKDTLYQCLVPKGEYKTGDLVVYIPEQAIVPDDILDELGLKGQLAGPQGNRVKAVRLRGKLSQGLCYPAKDNWSEGQDVQQELGIVKWEPPIPTQMSGQVYNGGTQLTINYDIQAYKKYPDVFEEGEEVVITEKIHGTWCQMGVVSKEHTGGYGQLVVTSKGLAKKGQLFIPDSGDNENNLYLRAARKVDALSKLESALSKRQDLYGIFVLGEVFGQGVQDLGYGANSKQDETLGFRVFDAYVGHPSKKTGHYLSHEQLDRFCDYWGFDRVPVLYEGPFSKEVLDQYRGGMETVSGDGQHIREGVVVRPVQERSHSGLGRVQLKARSDAYLERKHGTEYH